VLLASPSNPTGTSIAPDELRRIHGVVQARGGITLIDEIYLGLSTTTVWPDRAGHRRHIISINSFSKYFNMTGWRLGWMVVPDALVPVVERLAQNLFICPSTIVAACSAGLLRGREHWPNTNAAAPSSRPGATTSSPRCNAGPDVPVMPDGAFYAWADCTRRLQRLGVQGSWDFALS
jgi:aspartate/methionine/tyrosine aminotransferase